LLLTSKMHLKKVMILIIDVYFCDILINIIFFIIKCFAIYFCDI